MTLTITDTAAEHKEGLSASRFGTKHAASQGFWVRDGSKGIAQAGYWEVYQAV